MSGRVMAVGLVLALSLAGTGARAGEVLVAQAANFLKPMEAVAAAFERESGHRVVISAGSTGKLYAQIVHGAPFEVFLAADRRRPRLLEEAGLAVAGSRVTYAVGRLALWSRDAAVIAGDGPAVLRAGRFDRLAIANPKTAPFGAAAVQVMERLGVADDLRPKLVRGENVSQAFQFVESGSAELGFVALSQVLDPRIDGAGRYWEVPPHLHEPLEMDAVLLARGRHNPAARALLDYLRGEAAQAIITRYGYGSAR